MSRAFVLFSGGQDSTTCLYWARERFEQTEAVTLAYGQRHEVEAAKEIATHAGVELTCYAMPLMQQLGESVFVPGRNDFFLTLLAAHAYRRQPEGMLHLVTGVCQGDYSGFPDCRNDFIVAKARTLGLALERPVYIHTPLMWRSKAQTVQLAQALPGCWDALALSVTCYEGTTCGQCPACVLWARGFADAGCADPGRPQ